MPRVIQNGLSVILGASLLLGPVATAQAGESQGLSLRMRFAPDGEAEAPDGEGEAAPEPEDNDAGEGEADDAETSDSTDAAKTSPQTEGEGDGEEAADADAADAAEGSAESSEGSTPSGEDEPPGEPSEPEEGESPPGEPVTTAIPPPSSVRDVPPHLVVAIGLGPSAPGTKAERELVAQLDEGLTASPDPTAQTRRLRPGQGARRVCRDQRDDLVITVGYVADRPTPVLLPYDCALDQALGIRAADAAGDPGLLDALWDEHQELLRQGAQARRRITLGRRARAGIIAGVAIVVVGVAVGALVANALREESVVITVRP